MYTLFICTYNYIYITFMYFCKTFSFVIYVHFVTYILFLSDLYVPYILFICKIAYDTGTIISSIKYTPI